MNPARTYQLSARGYTQTSEGSLPHKRHPSGAFYMPVLVDIRQRDGRGCIAEPVRTPGGRLVYALPGGGRWIDRKGSR